MAADTSQELDRFRQQWQEEVRARTKTASSSAWRERNIPKNAGQGHERAASPPPPTLRERHDVGIENHKSHTYRDLRDPDNERRLESTDGSHPSTRPEPSSALEHFETAVQREGDGSLGDSLKHYRRAYRLDADVDRLYKNKHFPPSASTSKPTDPNPSNASSTVPNTAHNSLDGPKLLPISQLIASFQSSHISGEEPPTEASPRPCPISFVPPEILVNILTQAARVDPSSFTRLSQVCKRLAFLVAAEDNIWREVCYDKEYGFNAMHYSWALTITGQPLPLSNEDLDVQLLQMTVNSLMDPFALSDTYPSYKAMFQKRPRIRFNGCYISTVNYTRPGAASASQATWNSPVLIVTYYRYLRFFNDGSCISLLTTTEPVTVVRYLTKENLHTNHAGGLPTAVMNNALRGRWKLGSDPRAPDADLKNESTVHIETEGADADRPQPKYIYKVMLQMKSTSRAAGATRNNKLSWLGYWSYNKLTDDWAEFGLKNDRAFFWSRVKSYGNGD